MANKTTLALTLEQYRELLTHTKNGFTYNGRRYGSNHQVAFALTLEANTGLRISDIKKLRLSDIVRDGDRYRLNITEQKTHKKRSFTIPDTLYNYIKSYADKNGIAPDSNLIKISDRQIQRHLKAVSDFLNLAGIGTHSFRKFAASNIYDLTGHDIVATQEFLQHSSTAVTMRYMRRESDNLAQAINQNINII